MILGERLAGAIDELRVQMLGTEVLFGFQLESTFRPGFDQLSSLAHGVDVIALFGLVLTLGTLIGAPAQCRLVERGNASIRVLTATGRLAAAALLFLAATLACDGFIVTEAFFNTSIAIGASIGVFMCAMLLWFAVGWWLKRKASPSQALPSFETTPLHQKIKQMLHEAWVVLPGATGILGFQLMITTTAAFKALEPGIRLLHFVALALIAFTLMLLLTPAAIHRKAFGGADNQTSHTLGSRIVSAALAPLAVGIALDSYLAIGRMVGFHFYAGLAAAVIFLILITLCSAYEDSIASAPCRQAPVR
jgi:lysylphosphatidylglycerol synthetase-like protein (DUF2156 family)